MPVVVCVKPIPDGLLSDFCRKERQRYSLGVEADSSGVGQALPRPVVGRSPEHDRVDVTSKQWVIAVSQSLDHPVGAIVSMSEQDPSRGHLGTWRSNSGQGFFVELISTDDIVGYAERSHAGKGRGVSTFDRLPLLGGGRGDVRATT